MIKLDGLSVRYGTKLAVDDVSLQVAEGSVYALLGRNGAGKSSIVRCLAGLYRPDAGHASMLDFDCWRERKKTMQRVGVVPEEPEIPPASPVERILRFCAGVDRGFDAKATSERLHRFDIPRDAVFGRLSKGQKKLVSLALALGHAPKILLLDDPTLGLDVASRRALYEEIVGELADRNTTILVTSHDLSGIEGIADHVGFLERGQLIVDAPLEQLKAEHADAAALEEIFLTRTAKREEVA